jgi:hypothetical protein
MTRYGLEATDPAEPAPVERGWSAPVTAKDGGKQLSSLTWAVALNTTASNDPNSIGVHRHTCAPPRVLRQDEI